MKSRCLDQDRQVHRAGPGRTRNIKTKRIRRKKAEQQPHPRRRRKPIHSSRCPGLLLGKSTTESRTALCLVTRRAARAVPHALTTGKTRRRSSDARALPSFTRCKKEKAPRSAATACDVMPLLRLKRRAKGERNHPKKTVCCAHDEGLRVERPPG